MKPWYEVTEEDQRQILENVTWNPADFGYFRGGGYSSRFLTNAEMPVTMVRLNLIKGLGPAPQIAEGWTIRLPEEYQIFRMEADRLYMAVYLVCSKN